MVRRVPLHDGLLVLKGVPHQSLSPSSIPTGGCPIAPWFCSLCYLLAQGPQSLCLGKGKPGGDTYSQFEKFRLRIETVWTPPPVPQVFPTE